MSALTPEQEAERLTQLIREERDDWVTQVGAPAYASIVEMVGALECDYERLEELRADAEGHGDGWADCYRDEAAELKELEAAAGDCTSREDAELRIREDALELSTRGDWHAPGDSRDLEDEAEFRILLGAGGPAVRIMGELRNGEPYRAWLEVQDWFKPWTEYVPASGETLLTYARCFYWGG